MLLKRIVSGSLAFCLAALLIISSPIQARADAQDLLNILAATPSNARPVVTTEPDEVELLPTVPEPEVELEDDLDNNLEDIIGAGANRIEDFDPADLVPISPDVVNSLDGYEPQSISIDNDAGTAAHSVIAMTAGAVLCMYILWRVGASALTLNSGQSLYNAVVSRSKVTYNNSFEYVIDNVKKSILVTPAMALALVNKLDAVKAVDDTYSIDLTDDDKAVLGLVMGQDITSFDPNNVHIKDIDSEYKYYYILPRESSNVLKTCYVLYTPAKVAFATWNTNALSSSGKYSDLGPLVLYEYIAPANDPYQPINYDVAYYTLSNTTGYLEYVSDVAYTPDNPWSAWRLFMWSLPFNIVLSPTNNLEKFKECLQSNPNFLLDYTLNVKMKSASALMGLDTVSGAKDVSPYVQSNKNLYGLVTGVNSGAGYVTDTTIKPGTDTGTEVKPGTSTGTDTGTGTGSGTTTGTTTVDMTGVITELQTLKGIVTTMQSNVGTMSTTMTSVLAELQEIKLDLKDIASVAGTKVDLSPVLDVMDDVQADILDISDTIEVLRAEVTAQQELITDIKTNVAAVPALIDDVRADVKAIPSVIDGVRADVKTLTDTLLDVYPALDTMTGTITDTGTKVGSKVDALPGAITDTMADAITTDMSKAQTSNEWAMSSPLYDRFPFSIPWDVAGCVNLLVANPVKPVWRIPFKVDLGFYEIPEQEIVIDLSTEDWAGPVKVVRAFILIAFVAALAVVTRALIKG